MITKTHKHNKFVDLCFNDALNSGEPHKHYNRLIRYKIL